MELTASVVVAALGEAADLVGSERLLEDWRGFRMRGLDRDKFAMLHALLSGQYFEEAQAELGLVHAESAAGPWLYLFPPASVQRLAAMEEDVLETIGEELAATADFEDGGWEAERVLGFVRQMAELAAVARAQDKAIFLWLAGEE